jgi:L-2-hydroxyglutarate oxidase LhgO
MPTDSVQADFVIIGAGVLGCATASYISKKFKNVVIVLEAGPRIAEGVTSRNSGVIHAGLYYPPNSLKALSCIRGNALLYEWAEKYHVNYKKIGKLVVGSEPTQKAELEKIYKNGIESGASGLSLLTKNEIKDLEPNLDAEFAIFSKETGIIDQYEFTRSLMTHAENNGACLQVNSKVLNIEKSQHYTIETSQGKVETPCLINCAGLYADDIANMVGINKYKIYPCRGEYYSFSPTVKFNHLIYPVKDPLSPGLGVHLTIDIGGRFKLGPDTEYVARKDDFNPKISKLEIFKSSAEKLLGKDCIANLQYDSCGIRPKLRSPDEKLEKDFIIAEDLPGFVNCVGIESPGLTSALALAEKISNLF